MPDDPRLAEKIGYLRVGLKDLLKGGVLRCRMGRDDVGAPPLLQSFFDYTPNIEHVLAGSERFKYRDLHL